MNITGEQYIRTLAQYIRSNEKRLTATSSPQPSLGHLSGHRRSDSGGGSFSMSNLWSFSAALTSLKPTISTASTTPTSPPSSINNPNKIFVSLDPHHLYYLLAKFSDLGLDVGVFETVADFKRGDTVDIDIKDIETSSITSSNSISSMSSAMSSLSLFSGWQGWYSAALKNETIPINLEIQYIYRSFTKLTGLKVAILTQKKIDGFENWPMDAMLSLTMFKNLTHLEIHGLAPKSFDGWDILQEKLEYISLQQGSIDDIYELFVDAVVDSMKRRKPKDNTTNDQNVEKSQELVEAPKSGGYLPDNILPQRIWTNLKQVDLSDNSLTFVANEPLSYINKVINLNLSQNLLLAVPSGLSQLYNLQNLNLSNNMIESVTGIYAVLGNITKLDLRNNRIENLCGLERLWSLEYVDVRENRLLDWAEVGRMSELQEIRQIYVEGNPFVKLQPNYRISIFTTYRENNKDIILDGSGPSYNERRQIGSPKASPSNQKIPVAVLSSDSLLSPVLSSDEQTTTIPVLKTKKSRKFHKRVVKLDGGDSESDTGSVSSVKSKTNKEKKKKKDKSDKNPTKTESIPIMHRLVEVEKAVAAENDVNSRLRRKRSGKLRSDVAELSPKLRPSSPLSPRIESELALTPGEDYRRKIEELRTEGGSAWLRVLSEMEYSKGGTDRLREPPKMKAIADQLMTSRDHR
ncbi:hypothetical protein C1645_815784 [Glomus cerebriforme]|uniref:Uncharacterized protein n=1 Tax=Glomus cerebriforme TaxID=658196 RepID=A0A397TD39_9GLOM|nr:hypothetical protein C1645_815784 [Glomus cerebriforme]